MPSPVSVPVGSFLDRYTQAGAFADCYAVSVLGTVSLSELIEAFYTTRLFKVERWLLAKVLGLTSSDAQARQLATGAATAFSAWRVESRSVSEILLDAGQTRSWLSVAPGQRQPVSTVLFFGSAVIPRRTNGKFGLAFHALLGFHRLYSKLLLSAAAKRAVTLTAGHAPGAA
jgi:hypothetical protein